MKQEVEDLIAGLNPEIRKRILTSDQVDYEKLTVPSLAMNVALRGGLAYGRQVLVWGSKSSGKSSYCLQMVGEAQRQGKLCAWIDGEASFSASWAERLGVDTENLLLSPVKSINHMADDAVALMRGGVDVIVVDSISNLLAASYFEKDGKTLSKLENTKQMGADAKDMANAVKMMNFANENTLVVLISQERNNIGGYHAYKVPTGGEAVKFTSSTVIRLSAGKQDDDLVKQEVRVGDRFVDAVVGRTVKWEIQFNKTGPQFVSGKYNFHFDGDAVGVDEVNDVISVAKDFGVITTGGAWSYYGEHKWNGGKKIIEALREDPELLAEISDKVMRMI